MSIVNKVVSSSLMQNSPIEQGRPRTIRVKEWLHVMLCSGISKTIYIWTDLLIMWLYLQIMICLILSVLSTALILFSDIPFSVSLCAIATL